MTSQGREVAAGTAQLRSALEQVAAALTAADLEALLRAEGSLEEALRRLSALPKDLSTSDRDALRLEVRAARHTLDRCRLLGGALLDVVRLSLDAQGRAAGYGRQRDSHALFAPRTVNTTG